MATEYVVDSVGDMSSGALVQRRVDGVRYGAGGILPPAETYCLTHRAGDELEGYLLGSPPRRSIKQLGKASQFVTVREY